MKTQSYFLSIFIAPLRLAFSLGLTLWWAAGWVFFAAWHMLLFLILADRLDIPEQFTRHAQRKLHEQSEAMRFVWGLEPV